MLAETFLNGRVTLHAGDSRDVLKTIPDCSIDSIVTDPPYALVSIVKRFGAGNAAAVKVPEGGSGAYARASAGFMGKAWDTGETAFAVDFWAECLRVLKPGGHVVAFSGTRTYHRMACAIEDAGFEVRDMLSWLYGSGFPKSHDVSKGIDKMDAGAERRQRNLSFTAWLRSTGITAATINDVTNSFMGSHYLTNREQAAVPTEEMFSLLRPLIPTPPKFVEQLVAERTVESNNFKLREVLGKSSNGIAGGSGEFVSGNERSAGYGAAFDITAPATDDAIHWQGWGTALKPACEPICFGRKPLTGTVASNVLEHGTGAINIDGCRVEGVPEATRFDPAKHSHDGYRMSATGAETYARAMGRDGEASAGQRYTDEGSTNFAAMPGPRGGSPKGRWPANIIHDGSDEVIAAFPVVHGAGSARSGKFGSEYDATSYDMSGAREMGRFGDEGSAARFFYTSKADSDDRLGSKHPTVKPVDLMQWLCRLVTPKGGTVLDPFAGTGTTGEAAFREGFNAILIERELEYQADIRRRMALCMAGPEERARESIKAKTKDQPVDHGPLFAGAAE